VHDKTSLFVGSRSYDRLRVDGVCSVTVTVFGLSPLRRLLFTLAVSERDEIFYGWDLTVFCFEFAF